jgi:hypothetical protein
MILTTSILIENIYVSLHSYLSIINCFNTKIYIYIVMKVRTYPVMWAYGHILNTNIMERQHKYVHTIDQILRARFYFIGRVILG